MKERLLQLLDLEHLTPSKFADLIGVQRSSVSHILSDRNKPSFDFLQKTLKTFPGLNAEWLMLGEGPMYEQMGRESSDLFNQDLSLPLDGAPAEIPETRETEDNTPVESVSENTDNEELKKEALNKEPKVIKVILFYDDDTFHSFIPSQ